MDVHEMAGAEGTQAMWEPDGYETPETGTELSSPESLDDSPGFDSEGSTTGTDATDDTSTGSTDSTDGPSTGDDTGDDTSTGSGSMTVEVNGETRELPADTDVTGDGKADAVVDTGDGKVIVFADTEDNSTGEAGPDGKADEAYVVDKQSGQVVGAAHVDAKTGQWVDGPDTDGPSAAGGGTDEPGGPSEDPDPVPTGTDGPSEGPSDAGMVTVEADGHEFGVEKTIDADHDGTADTGVLQADGQTVAITDTDGDGDADRAAVFDADGDLVGTMVVDPESGEWVPESGGEAPTGETPTGEPTETPTESPSGSGSMTVEVNGESHQVEATTDVTGDGKADAVVDTGDGKVIVFADTEDNSTGEAGPDGKADEAYVVDKQSGQVVGAAHVDAKTGQWVDGPDSDGPSAAGAGAGSPTADSTTV